MLLDERRLRRWAEEAVDWAAAKIKGGGWREFKLDRRSRGGGSGAGWREMDLEDPDEDARDWRRRRDWMDGTD